MKYLLFIVIFFSLTACKNEDLPGLKDMSGNISGNVITYDQFGDKNLMHDDVSIRIRHLATSAEFSAITAEDGLYLLENIPMGEYEVFYTKENLSKYYIGDYKHLGGTQTEYINDIHLSEMLNGDIELNKITYPDPDSTYYVKVDLTVNNIPSDTTKNIGVIVAFSYQPDVTMNIRLDNYGYYGELVYMNCEVSCKKNITLFIPVWYVVNSESCGCGYTNIDTLVYCQAYLSNSIIVGYNERGRWASTISSISDSSSVKSFWFTYETPPDYFYKMIIQCPSRVAVAQPSKITNT